MGNGISQATFPRGNDSQTQRADKWPNASVWINTSAKNGSQTQCGFQKLNRHVSSQVSARRKRILNLHLHCSWRPYNTINR